MLDSCVPLVSADIYCITIPSQPDPFFPFFYGHVYIWNTTMDTVAHSSLLHQSTVLVVWIGCFDCTLHFWSAIWLVGNLACQQRVSRVTSGNMSVEDPAGMMAAEGHALLEENWDVSPHEHRHLLLSNRWQCSSEQKGKKTCGFPPSLSLPLSFLQLFLFIHPYHRLGTRCGKHSFYLSQAGVLIWYLRF